MLNWLFAYVVYSISAGIFYWLILRPTSLFRVRRLFILGIFPLSALLASIRIPIISTVTASNGIMLPVVNIGQNVQITMQTDGIPLAHYSLYLYIAGSILLLVWLVFKALKLYRYIKSYPGKPSGHIILHQTPNGDLPGSFSRHIFLPSHLDKHSLHLIMQHEQAHVLHHHSTDNILMECMSIMLYPLPHFWLLKTELKMVHEFEADHYVLSLNDEQGYKEVILQTVLGSHEIPLTQSFSMSNIKSRFMMINKQKTKPRAAWRAALIVPALAIPFLAFQLPSLQNAAGITSPATIVNIPQEDVYPQFKGGQEAMFDFITKNVTYPDDAKTSKIEGKVTVGFVIKKDGSIDKVEIKRTVWPSLDKEALRVVKSMPAWTPGTKDGKPADFEMTLPIMFKLS